MRHPHLDDEIRIGAEEIEALHQRLHAILCYTLEANDADFPRRFTHLVAALEEIFAREEALMERTMYPDLRSHREEHARALNGMHHVHASLMAGNTVIARKVVSLLLPDWLRSHMASMDAPVAAHMKTCDRHDYKPSSLRGARSGRPQFWQ